MSTNTIVINSVHTNRPQSSAVWPDALERPTPEAVQQFMVSFWETLETLPSLVNRKEYLLAEQCTTQLREIVLAMMLALNGIRYPAGTRNLNTYLSDSQRVAIQKTMLLPDIVGDSWVGQAVSLVVIYRWYAPQLIAKYSSDQFQLTYPQATEERVWSHLRAGLPTWPKTIDTDEV